MHKVLPLAIAEGAVFRANEYAWTIPAFPQALQRAEALGYACLGGQFQFLPNDKDIYEMYWLSVDSNDRLPKESWSTYCRRSCSEVAQSFARFVANRDFEKEAANWPNLLAQIEALGIVRTLFFIAYFVDEAEWSEIDKSYTEKL